MTMANHALRWPASEKRQGKKKLTCISGASVGQPTETCLGHIEPGPY
jgi:hypothetical protein